MKKMAIFLTVLSSLTLSNIANATQSIPQQCKTFFHEAENLITKAEKQPGTHTQVNKIKSKLEQNKQHILEMELATQIKSCDLGLAKLSSLNLKVE